MRSSSCLILVAFSCLALTTQARHDGGAPRKFFQLGPVPAPMPAPVPAPMPAPVPAPMPAPSPAPSPAPQPAPSPAPQPAPPPSPVVRPPPPPKHKPPPSPKPAKCNVKPVNKVVKSHGPCITQYKNQPANWHGMEDCWTLAFQVAQWGQPNSPKYAEFHDNWEAAAKAYPEPAKVAQQVADDFNTKTRWKVSDQWSPSHPYVRLCVPSKCGLTNKKCNLKPHDFVMHLNPGPASTDSTTHTFYKAFIRDGHILFPNAGKTAHAAEYNSTIMQFA